MNQIADKLGAADIKALAVYFASLPPPPATTPLPPQVGTGRSQR
jgi:cytochrome c553